MASTVVIEDVTAEAESELRERGPHRPKIDINKVKNEFENARMFLPLESKSDETLDPSDYEELLEAVRKRIKKMQCDADPFGSSSSSK